MLHYPPRYNSKNKKIIAKELQIQKVALKIAEITIEKIHSTSSTELSYQLKIGRLNLKYQKLVGEWFELCYKNIVGKRKTFLQETKLKRKSIKIEYIPWIEDFVDEDTGAVVPVERTKVVKINGKLVDANNNPIKFQLIQTKPYNF
jgi:hypothetical protein